MQPLQLWVTAPPGPPPDEPFGVEDVSIVGLLHRPQRYRHIPVIKPCLRRSAGCWTPGAGATGLENIDDVTLPTSSLFSRGQLV
ncbi:hypothetical protein MRB53_039968 [Persea americana]|nr:hypothetical protein MRB53_039968 [Persea americana]